LPELPEVEVIRQGLLNNLPKTTLKTLDNRCKTLRYPIPATLYESLAGLRCLTIIRRGKYLIFDFEKTLLAWHLGMTGQFRIVPSDTSFVKHEHLSLNFHGGVSLRYRDVRRFGYLDIIAQPWQQHRWFKHLGVEPLDNTFNPDDFYQLCQRKKVAIKTLIMDARAVVGIGNIYAAESLFRAAIHPERLCFDLKKTEIKKLVFICKQVLNEAIRVGGSSISDFIHVDGKQGYFSHQFQVYGRHKQPCYICSQPIQKMTQTGRSTFYCASCQY